MNGRSPKGQVWFGLGRWGRSVRRRSGRTGTIGTASAAGGAAALTSEELIARAYRRAQIGAAYYTPVFPNADGEFTIVLDNQDYHAATNNTDVGVRFTLRPFGPSNDLLDANRLS